MDETRSRGPVSRKLLVPVLGILILNSPLSQLGIVSAFVSDSHIKPPPRRVRFCIPFVSIRPNIPSTHKILAQSVYAVH